MLRSPLINFLLWANGRAFFFVKDGRFECVFSGGVAAARRGPATFQPFSDPPDRRSYGTCQSGCACSPTLPCSVPPARVASSSLTLMTRMPTVASLRPRCILPRTRACNDWRPPRSFWATHIAVIAHGFPSNSGISWLMPPGRTWPRSTKWEPRMTGFCVALDALCPPYI